MSRVAILDNSNIFQSHITGENFKMNYNVKTIEYTDSIQVRTYKKPITVNNKIHLPQTKPKARKETHTRTLSQIAHSEKSSVNRTINQIYAISRANKWEYFITLTIDPALLNNTDFNLVSEKLNIWTNNLKKRYAPDLKYIFVPELHKDKRKWHFHGLFSNIGSIPLSFSGKTCIGKFVYDYAKKPYATKVYNLPLWKYGFSTATQIKDTARASSYITKYITKDVSRILQNQHRYLSSQNCEKPIEKVYNVDYNELTRIYSKYLSQLSYMSDVELPSASQEIIYMEFNKNGSQGNPVDFSILEPKEETTHTSQCIEDIEKSKKEQEELAIKMKEKTQSLTNHILTGKEHIKQLRELKVFLKDNPDMTKVYADLPIDFLIMQTKRKIYLEEEKLANEQNRQDANDFIPCSEVPF